MLYPTAPAPMSPMHYLDSAALLLSLQTQGRTRAELSRLTGLSIPQVTQRLALNELDEGLRAYLRREAVPEAFALALLRLPDAMTRHRIARRIVREQLCIRDAALLIGSARRRNLSRAAQSPHHQHVITLMRDVRPYRNAICDIVAQMQTAGVHASFTERQASGMQVLTIAYPIRRRRTERYASHSSM